MSKKIAVSIVSFACLVLTSQAYSAPMQGGNQPGQMNSGQSQNQSMDSMRGSSDSQKRGMNNPSGSASSPSSSFSRDQDSSPMRVSGDRSTRGDSSNFRSSDDKGSFRATFSNDQDNWNDQRKWDRDSRDNFRSRDRFEGNIYDRDDHYYDHRNVRVDDTVIVRLRKVIQDDRALAVYAPNIDYIACGDSVIVFGVVDSDQIKTDIERRLSSAGDGVRVQNKLIVKK